MKFLIIVGGLLVGGVLWIGVTLRRRWYAPFDNVINKYKHPALHADPRERMWDHERWK